jgi:thiamine biosynthesis lipoprotein
VQAVASEVEALDRLASRFRPDSELSQLNHTARPVVEVSPQLAHLISVALQWARRTDGLVDPTVGAAIAAAGYDIDFDQMVKDQPGLLAAPERTPGWRTVELEGLTVHRPVGVLLDLGATAKAWGADCAASAAAAEAGASVLVSLGGDIATAGPLPAAGWIVRVADDHRASLEDPGQNVSIRNRGLATSSTMVRRWRRGGQIAHHLIDPRTGVPCIGRWQTVSVAGDSCLEANALSTAAIVAGDGAEALLAKFRAPARLVSKSGDALHLGGWPADGDDCAAAAQPQAYRAIQAC